MKLSNKTKNLLGLMARFAGGGVFIYAGFLKAMAPQEEFAYAIEAYKAFPPFIVTISAFTMPWMEIYLGIFLVFGLFTKTTSLIMGGLLAFFEILILSAIIRGLPLENCGCFGAGGNSVEFEFFQNLVILCFIVVAYKFGGKFSFDEWFKEQNADKLS